MNIEQLLSKQENQPFTIREMSDVVAFYILQRKGVRVEITIEENIQLYPNMFQVSYLQSQVTMLIHAFDIAKKWLLKNGTNK